MKISSGKFSVTIDENEFSVSLPDTLSRPTLEVKVGASAYVVQVPTRDFAGNIRLRFEGTAFDLKVIPTECAEYLQRMPEKPKPDVSKQVCDILRFRYSSVEVGESTDSIKKTCSRSQLRCQDWSNQSQCKWVMLSEKTKKSAWWKP